jgi:hypothetical protein
MGNYNLKLTGKDGEVKWEGIYDSQDHDIHVLYTAIMRKVKDRTLECPEDLIGVDIRSDDSLLITYESEDEN